MQYGEVIAKVDSELGLGDRARAGDLVTATLDLLGQRLAGREPVDLAAQLPRELKESLTRHTGSAEEFDVDEFLRRLAQREGRGVSPEQARDHARAVLSTINSFVSRGEVSDVQSQLPAGYALLFA